MIIYKDYKYELDPNNMQKTILYQHAGASRYAYNWALERVNSKTSKPNAIQLHREWNTWKRENAPWWNTVSKCVPQETFRNLQKAFEGFFKKKTKYPSFKSKKRSRNSFRLTGTIKSIGKYIQLPKLGKIKLKENPKVKGEILAATIIETANKWFVSIRTKQEIEVTENQGPSIGVDLGVKNLATLSNGQIISGPKALKLKFPLLSRINRKLARTKKGSKRRERIRHRLAKLHYKIGCTRSDSIHKLTTMLAKEYGAIGIEDLCVSGMVRNRGLARCVSDMGFGEFRRQLVYKTGWFGSRVVVFDRFFASSKLCSVCGCKKVDLGLGDRVYVCDNCGLVINRDLNAARNLCPAVRRVLGVEADSSIASVSNKNGP